MTNYLDFEKGLAELQGKAEELRALARQDANLDVSSEADQLEARSGELLRDLYANLTPWQKCLIARHPERPHAIDYINALFTDYMPLAGDRNFAEDHAIVGGLARIDGRPVVVMGHEKGHDTKTRLERNFGMARPEGYRKVLRLMEMADKFGLPVITLVDTPGAYPGKGAEERGQAEAIARSTEKCLSVGVPLISVIIGEGGSGGALAIGVGDRVNILEYSTYSVISPEGCASILWKSADKAPLAAEAMGITSDRLKDLGLIDAIVAEPLGGAHRDMDITARSLKKELLKALDYLDSMAADKMLETRYQRLMSYGQFSS